MVEFWDWMMRRKILIMFLLILFTASGMLGYRLFSSYAHEMVAVPALGEITDDATSTTLPPPKDATKSSIGVQGGGKNIEVGETTADNSQPRPEGFARNSSKATQSETKLDRRKVAKIIASCTLGMTLTLLSLRYAVLRFWR